MRKKGFEPSQTLSHKSLNLARLTTPALPLNFRRCFRYKKLYSKKIFKENFKKKYMIKLLGMLDIITAVLFWGSVLLPVPGILLGLFGIYILAKGVIFVGFGLDILSLLDIISGFIVIASVSVTISPILVSIVCVYLIGKGALSIA
jgi:hypothetical protein